jgi:hypothetical protein
VFGQLACRVVAVVLMAAIEADFLNQAFIAIVFKGVAFTLFVNKPGQVAFLIVEVL